MRFRRKLLRLTDLTPMAHRPTLKRRYWAYSLIAYTMPVVAQVAFPNDPTLSDELIWLVTLVPAFLLALHFGMKGAIVSLLGGTALFVTVQLTLAINYTADDWRITVPTYIAYGVLTVSVGWLSQQLHDHYHRTLEGARVTAVEQVAVTVRHEINNALMTIAAESHRLAEHDPDLGEKQRNSARSIYEAVREISTDIQKLTNLATAPVTHSGGVPMLDLDRAREH